MDKKKRVLLRISLFLFIGFLTTSIASYIVSIKSIRYQISKKQLHLTSDNVYSEVQNDILKPIFISSLMASDTFLRDWVIDGEKDQMQIAKYLKEIKQKYSVFSSFFVSDKTRKYYYPDGLLKTISPDESRDIWYFRVKKMKGDYEINVDVDMANSDQLTIFINYKVYDYNNNYIGTTGVGLSVDKVKHFIKKCQESYNSTVYFTDKSGEIQLSSTNFDKNIHNIKEVKEIEKILPKILSNSSSELSYKKNSILIMLNARYIPEFDWILIVEQSSEEEERALMNTLLLNLLICLIITILIVSSVDYIIKKYQDTIEKMALTDKLTGTYNRKAFDIFLENSIKEHKRNLAKLSLIMLDIDNFKEINDCFGHNAGDIVIEKIAEVMKSSIRESDDLFRWGGDEFIILLKECPLENAFSIAEKLREKIYTITFDKVSLDIKTTISSGVAEYIPDENPQDFLKRADVLLYKAKDYGRNRTEKV